jgi:hypothetical protein
MGQLRELAASIWTEIGKISKVAKMAVGVSVVVLLSCYCSMSEGARALVLLLSLSRSTRLPGS